MIATTIISSTSVKPRWFRIFLCQKLNMSLSSSLGLGLWTARAASLLSGFHWVHDRCQTSGDLLVASPNARGTRNCMEMVRSGSRHRDRDRGELMAHPAWTLGPVTALVTGDAEKCHGSAITARRPKLCFCTL